MKEKENGIYGVFLLYGVLLVLIAFLLKSNTNKAEGDALFCYVRYNGYC